MSMLERKKALLAGVESVYGVGEALDGATNAILTKNLQCQRLQGPTVNRDVDRPELGNDLTYHVAVSTKLTFDVELAGSGAAGTAPAYGVLLRGCGLSETVNAGVDVVYEPVSEAFESLTMHYFQDGELSKLVGARGTVKFGVSKSNMPMMSFEFTGLRVAPEVLALPTADTTSFQVPVPVNKANTVISMHGIASVVENIELDLANNIIFRDLPGDCSVLLTDRSPAGTFTIEKHRLGVKDWESAILAHETGVALITHGITAGNICELNAPRAQLTQPQDGDADGILTMQASINILPVNGDDELTLTVR